MSILIFFIIVMAITTMTDIKYKLVYNVLLYPAILTALLFTNNLLSTTICLILITTIIFLKKLKWEGGDLKIICFVSACFGWLFIPIFILTKVLISTYRFYKNYRFGLPVTPFMFLSSIIVLIIAVAFKKISF